MDNHVQHEFAFQLKLLLLFFHRAFFNPGRSSRSSNNDEYRFYTEKVEAKKFDNVILQFQKGGEAWKLRLIHAKHETRKKSISIKDLLSVKKSDEFSIKKYFQSFLNIRQRCLDQSTIFEGCEVMDQCIITNVEIDQKTVTQFFTRVTNKNDILITNQPKVKIFKIKNTKSGTVNHIKKFLIKSGSSSVVDVEAFIDKFKIIHFPDRHVIDNLLCRRLKTRWAAVDTEVINSRFIQKTYDWIVDRRSTFHTKESTARIVC